MTTPPEANAEIDWEALKAAAREAAARAYAPYSNFHVGAAALTNTGHMISGCNVENVSYGLTLCAECGLVSRLHSAELHSSESSSSELSSSAGHGSAENDDPGAESKHPRLRAVVTVSGTGEPCPPCGRCRQLLFEHGGPECLIDCDGTIRTVGELLPLGFSPERLAEG